MISEDVRRGQRLLGFGGLIEGMPTTMAISCSKALNGAFKGICHGRRTVWYSLAARTMGQQSLGISVAKTAISTIFQVSELGRWLPSSVATSQFWNSQIISSRKVKGIAACALAELGRDFSGG